MIRVPVFAEVKLKRVLRWVPISTEGVFMPKWTNPGLRRYFRGKPGTRFREFYDRKGKKRQGLGSWKGIYKAVGICLVLGGFLLSIPPAVPGFIVTIAGIKILVARSYFVATFLDVFELSVHCVFRGKCANS